MNRERLARKLTQVAFRLRIRRFGESFCDVGTVVGAALALGAGFDALGTETERSAFWAVAAAFGAIATGVWAAGAAIRIVSTRDAARALDATIGFRELFATAAEVLRERESDLTPFERALVANAAFRAEAISVESVAPIESPRGWRRALVSWGAFLLAIAAGYWDGNGTEIGFPNGAAIRTNVESRDAAAVRVVAEVARGVERRANETATAAGRGELEELADSAKETVRAASASGATFDSAIAALSETERLAERASRRLEDRRRPAERAFRALGDALASTELGREIGEALESGDFGAAAEAIRTVDWTRLAAEPEESRELVAALDVAASTSEAGIPSDDDSTRELAETTRRLVERLATEDSTGARDAANRLAELCSDEETRQAVVRAARELAERTARGKSAALAAARFGNAERGVDDGAESTSDSDNWSLASASDSTKRGADAGSEERRETNDASDSDGGETVEWERGSGFGGGPFGNVDARSPGEAVESGNRKGASAGGASGWRNGNVGVAPRSTGKAAETEEDSTANVDGEEKRRRAARAARALETGTIPLERRAFVRRYFDSLGSVGETPRANDGTSSELGPERRPLSSRSN